MKKNRTISEKEKEQNHVTFHRVALHAVLKEFFEIPKFLRQRRELIKTPQLAFQNSGPKGWKNPFGFAIRAGTYLGLLSGLMVSSWVLIPSTLRNKPLLEYMGVGEEQRYVQELQLTRARILDTSIGQINDRIKRYNERVRELRAAESGGLAPVLVADEVKDLNQERSRIESLQKELAESLASPIDSQYRDNLGQLDEDIADAEEDLEHSNEVIELFDRYMEFIVEGYEIVLPLLILVSVYAFRFCSSIRARKTPQSVLIRDRIYLYLIPASLFWNYILSTLLACVCFAVFWMHPALAGAHWFSWVLKGGEVVALVGIIWNVYHIVKRASQTYPINISPWRVLISFSVTSLAVSWVYFLILIGIVVLYAHYKVPWLMDWLLDAN